MTSEHFETPDDAIDAMRLAGGSTRVGGDGDIIADHGSDRYALRHDGEWYWNGPYPKSDGA